MNTLSRTLRRIGAGLPLALLLAYGLLVSSPRGEAGGGKALQATVDPRLELAGMVGRLATDSSPVWPSEPALAAVGTRLNAEGNHPAVARVRRWVRHGFTAELLAALLMRRGPWPEMAPDPDAKLHGPLAEQLGPVPGAREFDPVAAGFTAETLDSLTVELHDLAARIQFDAAWQAAKPLLDSRASGIEGDPTFAQLTARLADFFGESPVHRALVAPTLFGAWRAPFAFYGPSNGQVTVVDRASGFGRFTPETSLSWVCAREFARPLVQRITAGHASGIAALSGYWDYFKQGVAATTTTGWEDCLSAHLFRAIDLRVRPSEDALEREVRLSAALEAGLGMVRAVDNSLTGYDRSRSFYRRFADYFPSLLQDLTGLEPRQSAQRPRLGVRVAAVAQGVRVTRLIPGYPAAVTGLVKPGDIIREVDGRPVRGEDGLALLIQTKRLGDPVRLAIEREGAARTVDLTLNGGRVEYEFFRPGLPNEPAAPPAAATPTPGR